jgi:hypothetical protein
MACSEGKPLQADVAAWAVNEDEAQNAELMVALETKSRPLLAVI